MGCFVSRLSGNGRRYRTSLVILSLFSACRSIVLHYLLLIIVVSVYPVYCIGTVLMVKLLRQTGTLHYDIISGLNAFSSAVYRLWSCYGHSFQCSVSRRTHYYRPFWIRQFVWDRNFITGYWWATGIIWMFIC